MASGTVACLAGATVEGPVTVQAGGTLIATGSSFSGTIDAVGAAGVFLTASTMDGSLRIQGATGAVVLADTTFIGPITLSDNATTGGATLIAGNRVNSSLHCSGNSPAPVNLEISNTGVGPKSGQCAAL